MHSHIFSPLYDQLNYYDQIHRCFCQFGRLYCTDRDCNNSTTACSQCFSEPKQPVCGVNGKTYLNRCFAVNCSGISPVNILNGACPTIVRIKLVDIFNLLANMLACIFFRIHVNCFLVMKVRFA